MNLSELYRDIVESSPDGLWVIDLDGRTVYANPEIARLHRIADEELAALTVFDTLDEDGRAEFARPPRRRPRRAGVTELPVEVRWVRSDGTVQWLLCRETTLDDDAGAPRALLRRYSDGTERHELIETLAGAVAAIREPGAEAVVSPRAEEPSMGRVLVVEDNHVNQLVATGLLTALGYATATADDGLAAIEAARDGASTRS